MKGFMYLHNGEHKVEVPLSVERRASGVAPSALHEQVQSIMTRNLFKQLYENVCN